jgi:hypothetical protein
MIVSAELFDSDHVTSALSAFVIMVIAFQGLLWVARRQCSTSNLGVWDGWLYVTGSMTIGIGGMSLIIAVPCTAAAVLITAGIALIGLLEREPAKAQGRFQRMVSWFVRHRMYQ